MPSKRWEIAQTYEKNWWDEKAELIDFEFYKNYATDLKQFINEYLIIKDDTKILEVGSGAGGIITFLNESKLRFAIDPLEDFYSEVENFKKQRDHEVKYRNAVGENLPFENNNFDLIIMDNVLDHCDNPNEVMKEVVRVLKKEGIIYFKQNTYHYWGKAIRSIMEFFTIDKGHPYTFSKKMIKRLIKKYNLKTLKKLNTGYMKTWKREFLSKNLKDKIKAFLLVTRNKRIYLLKKNS
ncbi:MAG: class I SAM-dependent methyltransferase [Chlorobi bacterium]|nr:class I SAM-dependent methyltransferase [Chlorobiota bacterium]